MRALVTGVAGFIGSRLAQRLLADGWAVTGIDSLTTYYDTSLKRRNVERLRQLDCDFEFLQVDLLNAELTPIVRRADVVFHLAGQPGVRLSWADSFQTYNDLNVTATQRLLEAARNSEITRFVFSSSSSVYGNALRYPVLESDRLNPFSPYGVTKLAAEHLCQAYALNFGVPVVSLRYFTVFGPGQRPDMAIHRMIEAAHQQEPFPVYGDGRQIRDFTYVDDVVDATIRAALSDCVEHGSALNVAGGSSTSLTALIEMVGDAVGSPVPVEPLPAQPGDVSRTGGSSLLAQQVLGWTARTSVSDGVIAQVEWQRRRATGR